MAGAVDNTLTKQRADFRRKLYLGFIIVVYITAGLCLIEPAFIFITVIAGFPLAIAVFCLLMGLMKGTAKMCQQSKSEVIVESSTEAK
jgi:VIT1/CCC1 family predicted Fe2+/Mn2+ transporter